MWNEILTLRTNSADPVIAENMENRRLAYENKNGKFDLNQLPMKQINYQ